MAPTEIEDSDVLEAIKVYNDPNQAELVQSLGFGPAVKYRLVHEGRFYDSKAIAGIAHGIATGEYWTTAKPFGGVGPGGAATILRGVGFFVDEGELFELTQLNVDKTHGKPAPYQYIVLLWAITLARSGESRLIEYQTVRQELAELLAPFAIAKTAPDPAMPWFALRNSGWWELQTPPSATALTDADVGPLNLVAGLTAQRYGELQDDAFAAAAVDVISQIIGDQPAFLPLVDRLGLTDFMSASATQKEKPPRVDWAWDELVLACDLVAQNGWASIPKKDLRVITLSEFLRNRSDGVNAATFRSVGSVNRKLENIRSMHPTYPGKPTKGGRLTQQVIDAFIAEAAKMHQLAQDLWSNGSLARPEPGATDDDLGEEELESVTAESFVTAIEGRVIQRLVKVRERDSGLRKEKIAESLKIRGSISCELCNFDFEKVYGELGKGYVEVHHKVPLHFSGKVESTTTDLILLCANCHRMIHTGSQWKTPDELLEVLKGQDA